MERMLNTHKSIIISNLSDLVSQTDLNTLVPELLERNVLKPRMIGKILNPSHPPRRQKTDLYIQILKGGPQAFQELIDSLAVTNHSQLANILRVMADSSSVISSSPLISSSNECLTSTNFELDGPCFSSQKDDSQNSQIDDLKKPNESPSLLKSFPNSCFTSGCDSKSLVSQDFRDSSTSSSDDKMFALPAYLKPLEEALRATDIAHSDVIVSFQTEKNLPVKVLKSKQWPTEATGKPLCYKMDSNPRGCLLLINNINFHDEENYPERRGADNDQTRVIELFKQFHFEVEEYRNKTQMEMETIVRKFSRKKRLYDVDCIFLIIMSHGEEGESKEDSEILGVDGVGLKALDIVSYFDNDVCPAAINKPKVFFLQACRGCLVDAGVTLYRGLLSKRIETDGRKVNSLVNVKIRSQSDIFIACPVPPGIMANRDNLTGAWFIQTIIEVFSAHAWNTHLEDLMKLVDQKIKRMNNLYQENFQSLTTKTIGWNKNLYFNPGLCKDEFGNTIRIGSDDDSPESEEGMDVVDSCRPKSSKNRIGNDYSRLKDNDGRTSWCCLH